MLILYIIKHAGAGGPVRLMLICAWCIRYGGVLGLLLHVPCDQCHEPALQDAVHTSKRLCCFVTVAPDQEVR